MKTPQWIVIVAGVLLATCLYNFGRTSPLKKNQPVAAGDHHEGDGHNHGTAPLSTDSILAFHKKELTPAQREKIVLLEHTVTRGDVKAQQVQVYRDLARFWADSARNFDPYAWYTAEAARLENSEKTLTFAAHLFLDNLQVRGNPQLVKWRGLQAKDLFERSLKINPDNDSSKVGLGACYLFGNISEQPMEGLELIRGVVKKDSTNVFAQITLAKGSLMSKQFDKAIARLQTIYRLQPDNVEAMVMMADTYNEMGNKTNAIEWYKKSLKFIDHPGIKNVIEEQIESLSK